MQQSVEQYKERQEIQEKLKIFSVKKLWMEALLGEEKAEDCKESVKQAKTASDELKMQYDSKVRSQELIQKKKIELKEEVLEKVSYNRNEKSCLTSFCFRLSN